MAAAGGDSRVARWDSGRPLCLHPHPRSTRGLPTNSTGTARSPAPAHRHTAWGGSDASASAPPAAPPLPRRGVPSAV